MIIAVDVGNTNVVIGLIEDGEIRNCMRCATDRNRTSDEMYFLLLQFLSSSQVDKAQINGGIISSVVPVMKRAFAEAITRISGAETQIVGPGLKTGLNIKIDNPSELGSDLVVASVAALSMLPPPLVIIDMGTATTFSIIDENKQYLGGLIIPGLQVSINALAANAAQLRNIDLDNPGDIIGKNTVHSMKSGAIYSQAAMIDGLIARITEALGATPTVVATGGLFPVIHPYCHSAIRYEKNLILEGLNYIYHKNCPAV